MKKCVLAIVIAFGALLGLSAVQAAPLTSSTPAIQNETAQDSAVTKVYWRGYGWRRPYYGYGWRGYGWRRPYYGYGWRGYGWRRPYYRWGWRGYGWRRGWRRW